MLSTQEKWPRLGQDWGLNQLWSLGLGCWGGGGCEITKEFAKRLKSWEQRSKVEFIDSHSWSQFLSRPLTFKDYTAAQSAFTRVNRRATDSQNTPNSLMQTHCKDCKAKLQFQSEFLPLLWSVLFIDSAQPQKGETKVRSRVRMRSHAPFREKISRNKSKGKIQ